jgi:N-acetylglucosamine kinase-like BadF-type ATPase
MKCVLGVDGGNSKTIALIATPAGKILGWGRSGCGDIYNTGVPQNAMANVDGAVQEALLMAGCTADEVMASAFSMAGADWPEDFAFIEESLRSKPYGKNLRVVNDAVGALYAGCAAGWGVALANGTGGATSARSRDGKVWHSSFWQEGGGGRSLGERALKAVFRSELGITGATTLTAKLLDFYGSPSVAELLHQFSRRENPKSTGAPALGRLVLDAASAGDLVACAIVEDEARVLGEYILAAARQVEIADKPFPLVLTGSVFKHHSKVLPRAINAYLRQNGPSEPVSLRHSKLEPCAGAVLIAIELVSGKVPQHARTRLAKSTPDASFFST